jgi:hypothetical protein
LKVPKGSWKIAWMPSVNQTFSFLVSFLPLWMMAPSVACSKPMMMRAVVVLPQPLSPASAKISAGLM